MKKFLILCMSYFILLTLAACDNATGKGMKLVVGEDNHTESREKNQDNRKDNSNKNTETIVNNNKKKPLNDYKKSYAPESAAPAQTPESKSNTSPATYRTIYAQVISSITEDTLVAFIYLNDDDIPELVVNGPESDTYSIYTFKDGDLFCLVDSIRRRIPVMYYYERTGIICEPRTSDGGGDEGGYAWYYYQISTDWIITDDSEPILTWDYQAIYDENNHFTGEGQVTYSYMGQEMDKAAYEDACRNLGLDKVALGYDDVGRNHVCEGYGIEKEAALQMLSCQDSSKDVSELSGSFHNLYRKLYKKKLEELTDSIDISFVYLDDDDIPELAVCEDHSVYSIYTVRDGALFCIVDSIKTEDISYCERKNIIRASVGWEKGCVEKRDSYYQTALEGTLTNDSQPVLERSNDILYDEDGSRLDEETSSRYRYMGQDTDQETYEKKFKELGLTEDMEMKGMCYGNALEKEIALELLNP